MDTSTVSANVAAILRSTIAEQKKMIEELDTSTRKAMAAEAHAIDAGHTLLICVIVAIFTGICLFAGAYICAAISGLYAVSCYREARRDDVKLLAVRAERDAAWERYLQTKFRDYPI